MTDIIEKMARAIYAKKFTETCSWEQSDDNAKGVAITYAKAAIDALADGELDSVALSKADDAYDWNSSNYNNPSPSGDALASAIRAYLTALKEPQ